MKKNKLPKRALVYNLLSHYSLPMAHGLLVFWLIQYIYVSNLRLAFNIAVSTFY